MSDKNLTIIYGTETGNSKSLAGFVSKKASANGVHATVFDMDNCNAGMVGTLMHPVLFIVSTWDEGLPPAKARRFFGELKQISDLHDLNYAVLALGDTDYADFCKAGVTLDAMLKERGATCFLPLTKLGIDFDVSYMGWSKKFWQTLAVIYGVVV